MNVTKKITAFLGVLFSIPLFAQVDCDTVNLDFASSAPACQGEIVKFKILEYNSSYDYSWSFGSGATVIVQNADTADVEYSSSGLKSVTLSLLGTGGADANCPISTTKGINIHPQPTAFFTPPAAECVGQPVDFTNGGSSGTEWNYEWGLGSGANPNVSLAENPEGIIYSTAGTKSVTLIITDNSGNCSDSYTDNFTVLSTPEADFSSNAPACTGEQVNFVNTGSSGTDYSYAWDFGAGASPATSTNENPSGVVYSSFGNKSVRLIITHNTTLCTDTIIKSLVIHETPTVSFVSSAPECEGSPVNFSNTGSTGSKWSFSWDFGQGASPSNSTAENPQGVTYNSGGNKTITFTISDGNCTATSTGTITINDKPEADFTSTAPRCTGLGVDFNNTGSSGAGLSFDWDFGPDASPSTSTLENPSAIVFSAPGNKVITLITSNANCSDTISKALTIHETPTVSFASTAPQCADGPVNFTNTGSTGSQWAYSWDFGDGADPATSSSENPIGVTYNAGGNKTITFTISSGNCTATDSASITIFDKPVADFTSTAPVCTGLDVDFTNTGSSGAGISFEWDFGLDAAPATSVDENPAGITYSSKGNKLVTLIVSNANCTDTVSKSHIIHQTPDVSFVSTAPQCAGSPVNFSNTGSTGSQWSFFWDFGSGAETATSTSENPTGISYSSGGTKSITLSISDGFCNNTAADNIDIHELPSVDAGPDTTICANRSVEIGTPSAVAGLTFSWSPVSTLDDPAAEQPVASPIASFTTYYVTVTDASTSCVNTDSMQVTMVNSALVNAGSDVEICYGDSVQVGAALLEGQSYIWEPVQGLNDSVSPNPVTSPEETTLYTLKATYQGCDTITDNVRVTVHPLPDADAGEDETITRGDQTQLLATGGIMYEWSPEKGLNNPGINDPVASPDSSTTYMVEVTSLKGCVNSDTIIITVITPDFWAPTAFTPNNDGHNDVFYVRTKGAVEFQLHVFDRWGQMVHHSSDPFQGWDGKRQGNGEVMPSGAYVYQVKGALTSGEQFTQKGLLNLIR